MKFNRFILLLCFLVFSLYPFYGKAEPYMGVGVSNSSVDVGGKISFFAGINSSFNEPVDIYLALSIPGTSNLFFMGEDLQFHSEPVPVVRSWIPQTISEIPVFSYTFTGMEPEGEYKWYGAMFRSGTSLDLENMIGDLSYATFNFSIPPIIDWFPKDKDVLHTTEPDVFLEFKRPVDRESVIQHMEIKLTSLGSGKSVEVVWIDGQRWAIVTIPDFGVVQTMISSDEYINPTWTEENKKLSFHIGTYTIAGSTFSLHYGNSYELTFTLTNGATYFDGTPIPSITIGPIVFSVEDGN